MMRTRRQILAAGGGVIAALAAPPIHGARSRVKAPSLAVIEMRGAPRGERVWFRPVGLAVAPGAVIRFVNRDPTNSHTATAYHPDIFDRARRIPEAAAPWDSDFLLPGESFEVSLAAPGVHDYYCIPHEMSGMAGRIVVGTPDDPGWEGAADDSGDPEPAALAVLPAVSEILAQGRIDRGGRG